ncbi:trichohyalin [Reticulomyxa filosa]|uniref:Trichohyalin n=1 Tax=Reticulomyxa filosa TaxID=46433 RepID=X6NI85_RETFI|nr:trichohyalin [Reticulomyxa filosa]|eukprot:ETO25409.1 trichohyalin [Reticulomyxa filosa]
MLREMEAKEEAERANKNQEERDHQLQIKNYKKQAENERDRMFDTIAEQQRQALEQKDQEKVGTTTLSEICKNRELDNLKMKDTCKIIEKQLEYLQKQDDEEIEVSPFFLKKIFEI